LANDSLEEYMKDNEIHGIAYSPIGHHHLLKKGELISIADSLNISVPQLCISYLLKKGFIVIPKASSIDHLKDNYEA
jgi:diketogulonate reductase-like aldo/keto reductase